MKATEFLKGFDACVGHATYKFKIGDKSKGNAPIRGGRLFAGSGATKEAAFYAAVLDAVDAGELSGASQAVMLSAE